MTIDNGQNSKMTLDILILLLKHYILLSILEELNAPLLKYCYTQNSWPVSRQRFVFLSEDTLKEGCKITGN